MGRESPSDYAKRYHKLKVNAINGKGEKLFEVVEVTEYQIRAGLERDGLVTAIRKEIGMKARVNLHTNFGSFYFPKGDVMDPNEPFFWQTIRRAFGFKASPVELIDVLRLAYRCGRIGKGKDVTGQAPAALTAASYAKQFFSLDCNGFVGNYWGVSPEVGQESWAGITPATEANVLLHLHGGYKRSGKKKVWIKPELGWNGWVPAAELTLDYIPLQPRLSASEAKTGDVLIDVDTAGGFPHIAVVDNVSHLGGDKVSWNVVEWGSRGGLAKHVKAQTTVTLEPNTKLKKGFGVGFWNGKRSRFRYLFAAPTVPFLPAEWGRCGRMDL
jgi:hypothetical protein